MNKCDDVCKTYDAIQYAYANLLSEAEEELSDYVEKEEESMAFPSQVKAVNTIIGKNIVWKTLTEAIDELRHDNDIRDGMCDFDKLKDIIGNYKDKEGNPVVIESKF